MAFSGNAVPNTFKQQLFQGGHNFTAGTGNVFKLALYTSAATLNSSTTIYTSTNEVANSGQYTTGGGILTNISPLVSSGVAFIDFSDISFTGVTLTAADLGMHAKGGFALHPSVIEQMDEMEEEARSADVKGVVVRTATGKTVVRKQKVNHKIIGTGNLTDGKPDDTV